MIYHLSGISPYITKYIDFLKYNFKQFDLSNHYFIILDTNNFKMDKTLLTDIQYSAVKSKWGFVTVLNKITNKDSLIIHGLFNPRLLIYFCLFNMKLVERSIWSIWGGDVYFFRNKNDSFKNRFIEFLRKQIITRIPVITCLAKGDYEIVKKIYKTNANYIFSFYPNPVDFSLIGNANYNKIENDYTVILVGNSGDPSNNHKEVFDILAKYKNKNIKIICPLSYGNNSYIKTVISYGKKIFDEKFLPIINFLPPNEYIRILANTNIAIMNHNRQQALSNILLLLALNKKVYLKGNTSHYNFFLDNEILVFDVNDIYNISYDIFLSYSKIKRGKNAKIIKNLFSEKSFISMWKNVFEV